MQSEGPAQDPGPAQNPEPVVGGQEDGRSNGKERDEPSPVRVGVLISLAVGIVGITFGVLADSAGLTLAQAVAMSVFVFTGASQFAAVSVTATGGGIVAVLGASILLSARNTLYGPVVAQWFDDPLWRRLGLAHLIIDESTGVGATGRTRAESRLGFLVTGFGVFIAWNIGTIIGALSGDLIGDPGRFGLDVAFPASFLALLGPHLRTRPGRTTASWAAVIVLVSVSFVPVGAPILFASLAIIPGIIVLRRSGDVAEDLAEGGERP